MLKRLTMWTCFLALVLSIQLIAQSQPPSPSARKSESNPPNYHAESEQRETDETKNVIPPPSPINKTSIQEPAGSQSKKQRNGESPPQWWNTPNWWSVWLTGGILLLLIAHAVLFRRQANASMIAANAAKDGVILAERGQIQTERAYMLMKIPEVRPIHQGSRLAGIGVKPIVTNAGKTPAMNIGIACDFFWCAENTFPEHAEIDALEIRGEKLPLSAERNLSFGEVAVDITNELERVKSVMNMDGALHLLLAGRLEYEDIFRRPRKTSFCWEIILEQQVSKWRAVRAGDDAYHKWT